MPIRLIPLAFAALILSACDVASDVAGEALSEQVRAGFIKRCEGIAADYGIVSENVIEACDCAADNFAEQIEKGSLEINRETIAQTALECVNREGSEAAQGVGQGG